MLCIGLASKLDMMSQIMLAGLPLKIRFSMSTWCYECKKPSSLQVSKKYCTPHSRNKRKNMFFDQRDFRINNTTCREAPSDKCFKTNLLSKATFSSVCISAYCKQKICLEYVSFNLRKRYINSQPNNETAGLFLTDLRRGFSLFNQFCDSSALCLVADWDNKALHLISSLWHVSMSLFWQLLKMAN